MHRSPAPGYGSTRTFWQKLGIYCVGIAIGLMFLGWIQIQKRRMTTPPPQQTDAAAADSTPTPAGGPAEDPDGG